MSQLFISYARLDRPIAEHLYEDLRDLGLNPWLDVRDLLPGQNWKRVVTQEILHARFFLALLSSHSISKRGFVQKEVKLALEVVDSLPPNEIFIIPVRLEDCQVQEPLIQGLHWVDLFPNYESGLREVLRVLWREHSGKTVLHVEDDEGFSLEWLLEPLVKYKRVSLLSEAMRRISNPEIVHFIVDWQLPLEHPGNFAGEEYSRTPSGLIEKIRRERPDASVTVLTHYPEDPEIERLIRSGLLSGDDVIAKVNAEGLLARVMANS